MNLLKKVSDAIIRSHIVPLCRCYDVEKVLIALGAEISEGNGSRVRIYLNGVRAVFYRPHPKKETDKGALKSMRRFLIEAGVKNVKI